MPKYTTNWHFSSKFSAIYCQLYKFPEKWMEEESGIRPQVGHCVAVKKCFDPIPERISSLIISQCHLLIKLNLKINSRLRAEKQLDII